MSAAFALTIVMVLLAVADTGARPKADLGPWPRQALDDSGARPKTILDPWPRQALDDSGARPKTILDPWPRQALDDSGARPKADLDPWPRQALYDTGARPKRDLGSWQLKDIVNMTLCPTTVEKDVDELRVPKVIKTIRCAGPAADSATGHQRCNAHSSRGGAHRHHYLGSCVEVTDRVLVHYPGGYNGNINVKTVSKSVPVGCVCMLQEYAEATRMPEVEM